MKSRLFSGACSLAIVTGIFPVAAHGQSSAAPSPPAADAPQTGQATNSAGSTDPQSDGAAPASKSDAEILITGSRTITNGSQAPTPVTVVSRDQLTKAQPGLLAEGLNQLPALRGSTRPTSGFTSATGAGSGSYLNLRNLGVQRTLVLVDGRRFAPSSRDGSTDINLIPDALIKRVDVVTGGASAAYGSDAVAGVVNLLLDTHFTGIKADVQAGISDKGDGGSQKASLTAGTAFAGGRGHLVASIGYFNVDGIQSVAARDWGRENYGFIANPANTKQLIFRNNLRGATVSAGGLILSGSLAYQQFNPDGTVSPFNRGTLQSGLNQIGGDGPAVYTNLSASIRTETAFGRADFDVTPNLNIYAQVSAGWAKNQYVQVQQFNVGGFNGFTIFSGNAYLNPAVQNVLTNTGTAAFAMGRINFDFGAPSTADATARTIDATAGFSWKGPAGLSIDGYFEHGSNITNIRTLNNVDLQRLFAAADAVRDPVSNQIVCRVALTNPGLYPGCAPINLFGVGAPSAAAIGYVEGTSHYRTLLTQDVASLSLRGSPFSTWAGPVSIAIGGEYRREALTQTSDAVATRINTATGIRGFPAAYQNQPGGWLLTNVFPIGGAYHLWEVFGEASVPLARNAPVIGSLDLDGAVRYTNYSTSGGVTTWKLGAVWEPVKGLRFRGAVSRDIRAPNVPELFAGISQATSSVIEGGVTVPIISATSGNPGLKPEKAKTYTGGIVISPAAIPGLSISADYYSIDIAGIITSLTPQVTLDQCTAGAAALCANIVRNNAGTITRITAPTLNLNRLKTSGIDIDLSYRLPSPVLGGQLSLRGVAGYLRGYRVDVFGGKPIERVGEVGQSNNPHWTATASVDWSGGPFGLFVQERFISAGIDDATRVQPTTVENNRVSPVFYTDLTASAAIKPGFRFFVTVNNLFDKKPPLAPIGTLIIFNRTNPALYDVVGRYMTAGVKVRF